MTQGRQPGAPGRPMLHQAKAEDRLLSGLPAMVRTAFPKALGPVAGRLGHSSYDETEAIYG